MKCPRCKGFGRAIVLVKQKEGFYATEQTVCPECNGKGIIEQTNEEYLRSCNTEQLAEAIYECVMANSWSFSKDGIKRWLKQPHKDTK